MGRRTKIKPNTQKAKGRKRPRSWHRKGRQLWMVGKEISVEVKG